MVQCHPSLSAGSYLRLPPECHHLANIMDQSGQMEPFLVWMCFPDPFSCLEGMQGVGHDAGIRITLIYQVIQCLQGIQNVQLGVVKLCPVLPLHRNKKHIIYMEIHVLGMHTCTDTCTVV